MDKDSLNLKTWNSCSWSCQVLTRFQVSFLRWCKFLKILKFQIIFGGCLVSTLEEFLFICHYRHGAFFSFSLPFDRIEPMSLLGVIEFCGNHTPDSQVAIQPMVRIILVCNFTLEIPKKETVHFYCVTKG